MHGLLYRRTPWLQHAASRRDIINTEMIELTQYLNGRIRKCKDGVHNTSETYTTIALCRRYQAARLSWATRQLFAAREIHTIVLYRRLPGIVSYSKL